MTESERVSSIDAIIRGQQTKRNLVRDINKALAAENGIIAQAAIEKLIPLIEAMEDGSQRDAQMTLALRYLVSAQMYQNDGEAMQKTVAELTKLNEKMEQGPERDREVCLTFAHSGYAQLLQGKAENAIIIGDQIFDTAARLPEADQAQMRNIALTLLGFAYVAQNRPEIAAIAADRKIETLKQSFPEGPQRDQAHSTLLSLKTLSFLEQGKTNEARAIIQQHEDLGIGYSGAVDRGFADLKDQNFDKAYYDALALCNTSLAENRFDHAEMLLLRDAAYAFGRNNDYLNYVARVKDAGVIRQDDTTYDPIDNPISSEQVDALQDELSETMGRYARSRLFKTNHFLDPINGNAANVVFRPHRDELGASGRSS